MSGTACPTRYGTDCYICPVLGEALESEIELRESLALIIYKLYGDGEPHVAR